MEGVKGEKATELAQNRAASSLGLGGADIATAANTMGHAAVHASNEATKEAAFTLANTSARDEGVAVHESELVEQPLDGGIVPASWWQLPVVQHRCAIALVSLAFVRSRRACGRLRSR